MATSRPTRGIGGAGATLKRPGTTKPVSLVAALAAADDQAAAGAEGGGLRRVALTDIAAHPQNPRESLGELSELTASIREFGVLQPPVVIPADAFRASWPDQATTIGAAAWVIVAGHRRHAAAQAADLAEIDVIVREDLASREAAAAAFVVENVHRAGLEPLEEAQAYGLLADLGIGQREIARRTGVSQSHVSKRLSLLRLPQPAQDALAGGNLVISEAVALAAVKAEDQARVWDVARDTRVPIASAITTVQRDTERQERRAAAAAQAAAEGVEVIEPGERFGNLRWSHLIEREQEIEAARSEGTLVAAVEDAGLSYYTTAAPKPVDRPSASADSPERRKAMKGRRTACAALVAQAPAKNEAVADLVRAVANGNLEHGEAVRLVHAWLSSKYPAPGTDGHRGWLDNAMAAAREDIRLHLAWALTVARDEVHTSATWSTWGTDQARHIARLTERTGYTPTSWEQAKLAAISR